MLASVYTTLVALLAGSQLVAASPLEKRLAAGLTMPAKTILDLSSLLSGTVVNLLGDINVCGKIPWADGPCIKISGTGVTFNGNLHKVNGNGASYWDTFGGNTGGVDKPKFWSVTMSGTFQDVYVVNTPRHVFSIGNSATLLMTNVHIDNTAGNTLLGGKTLGHNTDCFDVSADNLTIQKSTCNNQDDCLAINKGTNIKFIGNACNGGHGISIGSIASDKVVSKVTISNNVVTNSDNGLRIKTISDATGASVSDVTYSGNTVTSALKYGIIIEQDYLNGGPTGVPTNGVTISNINFTSGNKVSAASGAKRVYVLCGSGSCKGTWNWSGLTVSGGSAGSITPSSVPITGFSF